MSYAVKELFYTLQGEGGNTGRAAVFCRFTGCNLWSGREEDRARAVCQFCDTDFVGTNGVGGGRFATAEELAGAASQVFLAGSQPQSDRPKMAEKSPAESRPVAPGTLGVAAAGGADASSAVHGGGLTRRPLIVCTGGEPLLQLDAPLVAAFHAAGFEVAIETNGTLELPEGPPRGGIDWVCVSPKAGALLRLSAGDELKLVFPQPGAEPERYAHLPFTHFFLQPMDGPARAENTAAAVRYCLRHPQWRLSLQTHKLLGIP